MSTELEHFPGTPSERIQAAVNASAAKLGAAHASGPMVQRQTPKGEYAGISEMFAGDRTHAHGFVALGNGDAVCHVTLAVGPSVGEQAKAALSECLREAGTGARASADGGTGAGRSTGAANRGNSTVAARGKSGADIPASTPTPSHPENWSHVKGVYFRVNYMTGVGGAMTISYQPVVLLDDGTAYETRQAAIEDVNFSEEHQIHPKDWSRWQQSGRTFVLTDDSGHRETYKLQDGSFFLAQPAERGGMLNGSYESVGGGGNSALGGEMAIMFSDRMNFSRDGRFVSGHDTVISGSGAQSGVSMGGGASRAMRGVGSYKLSRYTLEVHLPDGRVQRQFFAYSSQGQDARVDPEMIFVGDRPYTRAK